MSLFDSARRRLVVVLSLVALFSSIAATPHVRADASLPSPWASTDVGNTGATGSSSYASGTFSVSGAGDAIGGGYDQFQFVYQDLVGDGQITARILGIDNARPGTEAGLIIRETRDGWPPAREALVRINGAGEVAFEYRSEPEANATTVAGATTTAPQWLRLVRQNNSFTGYASADGATWTQLGTAEIAMGASVSIGLAASGNTFGTLATATFDNVALLAALPAPWQHSDVGNTGAAGSAGSVNGAFVVSGAGDEVGGSYDQFHYVYQPLAGDGQIVARVASITNGGPNTKAAAVIRETVDGWPPAREAIVGVRPENGAFFAARSEPEANAALTQGAAVAPPQWVKLVRRGNLFVGSISANGTSWSEVGRATIAMGQNVSIGLAAGGKTFGQLATSTFDMVQVSAIAAPVTVNVNWNKTRSQVERGAYGLNLFSAYNPPEVDAAYNANIGYMNPGAVRYHSWELMGDSKTTRNGWIDTANKRWDAAKIDVALDQLTALDPKASVMINIPGWPAWMDADGDEFLDADKFDAYAAFCADLVRIVNVDNHHQVQFWEPTNERDDLYYVRFKNANQPDRLNELIDIYNRAARAMKAVDPKIKLGGLAFARADLYPQVERFVTAALAAKTLDYLSMHGYASGDKNEPDSQIYNRAYNAADPTVNSLTKHGGDVRAILDAASPKRHIPIWFDEYNISWSFENNDPRMHNHKGAVYDALVMTYLHDAGVDVTNAWNEKDGVYGKTDNDNTLRPSAHLFNLLNRFGLGERVSSSSSDERAIAVYATRDERNGVRSLVVINRSNAFQQVNTNFGNWKPMFDSLARYEISAAGFTTRSVAWPALKDEGLLVPDNSVTVLVAGEKPLKPVLECVTKNLDNSYTAFFGYQNQNPFTVALNVGGKNRFTPTPANRGQPTVFEPGRTQRAFSVNFDGKALVWLLDGRTATASRNGAQACR